MKFYNHSNGIILVCILFLFWAYNLGKNCPCTRDTSCTRVEFYGVQKSHFILFIIIGILFPSYFYTFQFLGVLWELFENILDNNPSIVTNYIGGCLKYPPSDDYNNNPENYIVYRGIEKPLNIIDKLFNIKNSTIHVWHGSVAELIPNMLGFIVGYIVNKNII